MAPRIFLTPQARLMQLLQEQGFSPAAISYVQNAMSHSGAKVMANPATLIAAEARDTVRQFVGLVENAEGAAAVFRRNNIRIGVTSGAVASLFLVGEGSYAHYKTGDNYESETESLVTNFGRVASISGTATAAGYFMSKRGFMNKLMGLALGAGSVTVAATGATMVTTEHMNSLTLQNIKEARDALDTARRQEEEASAERQRERERLRAEIGELEKDREGYLSTDSSALRETRAEMEKEIDRLKGQIMAYEVKAGSPEAEAFIAMGYENVGINNDGNAKNDGLYTELKQAATEKIRGLETELAPIIEEIRQRTMNAGTTQNLSEEDRQKVAAIDTRIGEIRARIGELDASPSIATLRAAVEQAEQMLLEAEAENIAPDENLMGRLSEFLNTEKGLQALIAGGVFGTLSMVGGIYLHRSIAAFGDRPDIPINRGTTLIAGVPINGAHHREIAAMYEPLLVSFREMMEKGEGVENALMQAAKSHIAQRRDALQIALDHGILTDEQFTAANRALGNAETKLPMMLRASDFVKNMTRVIQEGAEATADAANIAGETARIAQLTEAKAAGLTARMGAKLPLILGVAAAGGGIYVINEMFSGQRAYAGELHSAGLLSQEAYDKYIALNQSTQATMTADTGFSVVDPTIVLGLLVSYGAESGAQSDFREWFDRHGFNLNESDMQALSMSMFNASSVRQDIVESLRRHVPLSTAGQPEGLHDVIRANVAMRDFYRNNPPLQTPLMAPFEITQDAVARRGAWERELDAYRDRFVTALADMAGKPENMDAYLNLLPIGDRLSFIRRLAASEKDPQEFTENYPEIARYVTEYNGAFLGGIFGISADDALYDNPGILNRYIMARYGVETDEQTIGTVPAAMLQQQMRPAFMTPGP